jgi:Flp pilus assembly protein TadG
MRCRFRASPHDRGSVTAEFAIALPSVVLVLAACLSGVQIAGQQLRLQDAAAAAARAVARGDGTEVASKLVPGAVASHSTRGDLECVTVSARTTSVMGGILGLSLRATSCALGGGR